MNEAHIRLVYVLINSEHYFYRVSRKRNPVENEQHPFCVKYMWKVK